MTLIKRLETAEQGSRELVCRIQDDDGRGPWRPGLSSVWADPSRRDIPPPYYEEFPDLKTKSNILNYGCGCNSFDQLRLWFNASEASNLAALGFSLVCIRPDKVLAASKHQVVFGTRKPLSKVAVRLPWRALLKALEAKEPQT